MSYTDLTAMRNDFLAKTQAKLLAKDFSTAADTDLIVSGALVRAFDSVNNFDPISTTALSMIGGVGDLNAYLADPSNRDAFEQILANSQAMTAVAASSTAMNAVIASSTAMNAVAASSTAMNTVIASSVAMAAIAKSKTALSAIWAYEIALAAIRANTAAINALISSSYTVVISNNPSSLTTTMVATKSILLQGTCGASGGSNTCVFADRYYNGVATNDYSCTLTDGVYSNQAVAFSNIRIKSSSNNYGVRLYIIDCD
jgi:hypothetical protein